MKRHFLALLLSLTMIISLLPVTAMAEGEGGETPPTSGYCGGDTTAETYQYSWQGVKEEHATQTVYKNIAWEVVPNGSNDNGTTYQLILTGSGTMFKFSYDWISASNGAESDIPWWDLRTQITAVDIADGITTISDYAFFSLRLESVEIPDSVTTIGVHAISRNAYLKRVVIGAGVTEIKSNGFYRAIALDTLTFKNGADLTIDQDAFDGANIETLTIPSRVRKVVYNAFGHCTSLKSVVFEGNTDLTLGNAVFGGCTALTDVDMSAVNSDSSKMGSVFSGCTALENVKLPTGDKFTKIPSSMFSGCTALKTVVIPENITAWGPQVFNGTGVHTLVFETQNMADEKDCGVNYLSQAKAEKVIIYTQKAEDAGWNKTGRGKSGLYDKGKQINAVTNGGTFPADTVFVEGVLAEPVLKDRIFEGWYSDASFKPDTKLENNAAPVVDKTYYANWAICKHRVSYTAEDNVITERCGCGSVMNTLTLNAPENLTYDGTAKECTIEKSENWRDQTEVTVEYYSGEDKLSGAPTNAGAYTAKVTVQGVTASVSFTIAKAEQDISYETTSVSKRVGAANFTNELTKTLADGAISYASSDESVAKVDATTGEVTIVGAGRATITATAAETANYNEATASYTLTVTRRHSSPSAVTPEPEPEPTPEETVKFADVSTSAYYYDAVKWAVENGVTNGLSDTMFGPYESCTRAQIVTFLWRAAGSPEPKAMSSFSDVPASAYYAKAVAWAVENGITNGMTETTFAPDATCTRGQSVTFLHRALKGTASGSTNFTDVSANAFYADAVNWAVANNVTNGTSNTTFSPNADCTRAEIVTFLYRAYQGK